MAVANSLTQYASALFYVKEAVSMLAIPGGAYVIRSYISEHAPLERQMRYNAIVALS